MTNNDKKQLRLATKKRAAAMREFRQQRGLEVRKGRLSREEKKLFEQQYGDLQSDDSDSDDTSGADELSDGDGSICDSDDEPLVSRFAAPAKNNNNKNQKKNKEKIHEDEQEEKRRKLIRDWYNLPIGTNNKNEEDNVSRKPNTNNNSKIITAVEINEELQQKREMMIEKARTLSMEEFLMFALKPATARTYKGYQNQVINTKMFDQDRNYRWEYEDILLYIKDPDVMMKKNNSTMSYIISAFKFLSRILQKPLDKRQEEHLQLALRARSHLIPDIPRQVGPITKERLKELQELYVRLKDQEHGRSVIIAKFSSNDCQELMDATTMMYGCALRVFQLKSLTINSFRFSNDGKGCVTVPAKSKFKFNNGAKMAEMKDIHPEFVAKIKEIVERRSKNNNNAYGHLFCTKWDNGKEYDKMLRNVSDAASIIFEWPQGLSWNGTHNFRHGGAADAFEEGGLQLVMLRTGHESENIALHYARTDLERLNKTKGLHTQGLYSLTNEQAQQWWNNHLKISGDIIKNYGVFTREEINESMYALNERGIQVQKLKWIDEINKNLKRKDLDVRGIINKYANEEKLINTQNQPQVLNNDNNNNSNNNPQTSNANGNNNVGMLPLRREREQELRKISDSYSQAIQQHKPFAIYFSHQQEVPEGYKKIIVTAKKERYELITNMNAKTVIRENELTVTEFFVFVGMNFARKTEYLDFPKQYNTVTAVEKTEEE